MQNKLQQRITGLLNAHRVKRKWKILTIVLSVIVLCNTFYALQNAAVALNDRNEEQQFEQTIDHVQNGAGNDIDITGVLESSRTETSSGTGTETAGDGTGAATTVPEGTESAPLQGTGSGTESTGTDEAGTGSTTPPVTEGLGGGVQQGDGTILDQSGDTVPDPGTLPEGYLPADPAMDPATDPWYEEGVVSSAPLMLSLARVPARAYTLPVNNRIASAEPFDLRITDMSGLPVSRATTSEALIVTVGWKVTDSTQIKAAGDYLDVVLPSQINFGADQFRDGSYRLLEDTRIFGGEVLPAGTSLADYEVSYSDTYGAYVLRIVFTAAGVRANAAGMLTTPALQDAIQWSAIRFEGVYFEQTGTFTPAITAYGSGKTVYNSRQITVIEKKLGQIKDVRIDSFAVNGVVNGTGVSVGAEDPLTLDIAWSWKDLSAFLSSGDYFEIALPESLVITPFDSLGTDTLGNVIRKQVYQNAQGAYILRITYESIGTGYNEFSGNISLLGYIRTKPVFTNGTANMTLTVSVAGGTSYRRAQVTVKEQGSMLADGDWRVRRVVKDIRFTDGTRLDLVQDYDYHVGTDRFEIETDQIAQLFVVASHGGALTPGDPFTDDPIYKSRGQVYTRQDQIVQFIPGVSNFIDAYCADPYKDLPKYTSGDDLELYRWTLEQSDMFNSSQKTVLRKILSTAYPYVSLEVMARNLGYSTISREEAVVAVQLAIWRVVDKDYSWRKIADAYDYAAQQRVEAITSALLRYDAGSGSGSGATNYSITNVNVTYNTDGSATVTGRVSPTPPSGLTGVLSNHTSTQSFTVGSDGRFSVTMADVSRADDLKIVISGYATGAGAVQVWVFTHKRSASYQPLIAAECGAYPIRIEWEKPGSGEVSRNIRIVKRWVDAEGNTMTTLPNQPVTVSLYRRVVVNGTEYTEKVETVTLRRGGQFGDYTWTISQLPVKDANGNVYDYYITEDSAPAGYTFVGIETDVADGGKTIIYTAVNREETTRVKVEKEWEGVADPAGYAVRVQLFVIVNGREVPVYLDKNPTDRNSYTIENGIRTLHGPYYFENAADRYPVIVYLNSKPDEGLSYIFDGLPVRLNGRRLQYVVREISAGPAGHADRWTVTRDQSTGTDWAGSFKVSYTPASAAPDMDAPLPTVTIKNVIEDTGITVVKEWTTLPENVKALSATVVLCKLVKQDGKDALVAVPLYVNVADTILDTSGDVIAGSAYATEKLSGYTKAEWVLAGANTQGIHNNSWRVTYRGLPKYEADGVTIARYTFVETGYSVLENGTVRAYQVEEGATGPVTIAYQQADMDAEQPSVTITNTYDRTRVIVTKSWEGLTEAQKGNYRVVAGLFKYDPSGRGGQGAKWPVYVRTDSIRTEVNAQGLVYTGTYSIEDLSQRPHPEYSEVTVELSADNNWTALFEDLPKYEADGKTPVQYIVRELAVYDKDGNDVTQSFNLRYAQYTKVMGDRQTYAWATEAQEGDGTARVDITNTITNGTITVKKKWLNFDGTGWFWATPAWIEVKLTAKRNGAEIPDNSDFWKGVTQLVRLDETNGWSYTWENILEEKGVTYYIEEIAVVYNRNGREIRIDAKDYTGFIGPDGPVEVVKKNGGGFEITGLENRRETTELIIIKEDKTDHSRLSGAEFTLYRIEEGVEVFVGTFKTGTDTSLRQGYQEGVVLVDGKNHEGLLFGYHYKLVETKAPEGYVDPLNNAPYILFTMNGSGTPYDPSDDWIEVLGSNENNDAVWETANNKTLGIRWLRVENTPSGYILPEAGGFGTHPYTTGGMSVMMATLLMYGTYRFMYKKEKGGRKNQRHT